MAILNQEAYNILLESKIPGTILTNHHSSRRSVLRGGTMWPYHTGPKVFGEINRLLADHWHNVMTDERKQFWYSVAWQPPYHETLLPWPKYCVLPAYLGYRDFRFPELAWDRDAEFLDPGTNCIEGEITLSVQYIDERLEYAVMRIWDNNPRPRPPACGAVICEAHPQGEPFYRNLHYYTNVGLQQDITYDPAGLDFEVLLHYPYKSGDEVYWFIRPRTGFRMTGWFNVSAVCP